MDESYGTLVRRVERLEREVAVLRGAPSPQAAPVEAPQPPGQFASALPPPPPPAAAPAPHRPRSADEEARVIGTWLARVGALAVLVGGGFAYSYAVDRGLIGPAQRVALGILVGVAFAFAGEWARRRDWSGWAQAVTGGAIGIWYLAIWAASERYELIGPAVGLTALSLITITAVALALRYRSEALAVLATIGALSNPFVVGVERPESLLWYVLGVDVGAVVLAALGPWRSLERVALAGTWMAVAAAGVADLPTAVGFGTAFAVLFTATVVVPVVLKYRPGSPSDGGVLVASSAAYSLYTMAQLSEHGRDLGAFVTILGLVHLALAASVWRVGGGADAIRHTSLGLGIAFLVLAVPLSLEGPVVAAVWTVQAVGVIALARASRTDGTALAGLALLALAILEVLVLEFELGAAYVPDRVLLSGEAALMVAEIGAVVAAASLLAGGLVTLRPVLIVAAHTLALTWLTFEVSAAVRPEFPFGFGGAEHVQAAAFGTTAVWALYAVALLVAGVGFRSALSRGTAVAILAAVVVKLVVSDLWLLETLYRTVAFVGLGALLLMSSLLYHRFRDVLLKGGNA